MADLVLASSSVDWALAAAGAQAALAVAYKNRRTLAEVWAAIAARLSRPYRIAVTGAEASGKSVLMDYLSRRAYERGYRPPGRSDGLDKETLRYPRASLELLAVPGQQLQTQRYDALDQVFLDDNKRVDGIIHVVANGFLNPSRDIEQEVVIDQGFDTIDTLRQAGLQAEIEEWEEAARSIEQHWVKHRAPMWLLVVVGKVDLYRNELPAARERYVSSATSPFVQRLAQLQSSIGSLNLRVQAAPACSHLTPFRWNREEVRPELLPAERDRLLAQLETQIKELCRAE